MAQKTVPPATPGQTGAAQSQTREYRSGYMVRYLSKQLNLTPDQQAQARRIFADTRKSSEALMPKIREEHEALNAAVKTGNDHEIDRILQQNSQLNSDFEAMHVKAMAKVYQTLTSDQKAKFDQLGSRWVGAGHHAVTKS